MLEEKQSFGARFGALVARTRGDLGVTQEELADQVYGRRDRKGDISALENGRTRRPQAKTVAAIAGALGISDEEIEALKTSDDKNADTVAARLLLENEALREQLKISESLAVALAYEYGEGTPTDIYGAFRDLRRALEAAAEPPPSDLSTDLAGIVAEVRRLTEEESPDAGMAALKVAMERYSTLQPELLDAGIRQAILTRSVRDAAEFLIAKVGAETQDPNERRAKLLKQINEWHNRGQTGGLAFDLEVSIKLSLELANRSTEPADKIEGARLAAYGQSILGQWSVDNSLLEASISISRDLLKNYGGKVHPTISAQVQMELANALRILGERTGDPGALLNAFAEAWKATSSQLLFADDNQLGLGRMHLGHVLVSLAQLGIGTATRDQVQKIRFANEASTAYRLSLPMIAKAADRLEAELGLANSLSLQGELTSDCGLLRQAIGQYAKALGEPTLSITQRSRALLGKSASMRMIGKIEQNPSQFLKSIEMLNECLALRSDGDMPYLSGKTRLIMGTTFEMLADMSSGTERRANLRQALDCSNLVCAELAEAGPRSEGAAAKLLYQATQLREQILARIGTDRP